MTCKTSLSPTCTSPSIAPKTRARIDCVGLVQGVGFRPTVQRLASTKGLSGWVLNHGDGVTVEVEGSDDIVASFVSELPRSLPPLARIECLRVTEIPCVGDPAFVIRDSQVGTRQRALVPPDAAICDACRADMDDPANPRYAYPFTTCTNCGPRFSLVHSLPYDRERTSMASFPLCGRCQSEYTDVANRRFHAEPVCCPACGPRLSFLNLSTKLQAPPGTELAQARSTLASGSIVAIKGIGGYQLACRADLSHPVETLRLRKRRPTKPFAVMVRNIQVARGLVCLEDDDEAFLLGPRSPIVLAPMRCPCAVVPALAPGLNDLGVMLPTSPLHAELFRDAPYEVLVMTSGNVSDEPICCDNADAHARLAPIADYALSHDRDIVRRLDDSVLRSDACGSIMVRRSRGWVPEPLLLPVESPEPIVAVGGHLQVTACVAVGTQAFLSQHVGDLDSDATRDFLGEVVDGLEGFLEVRARLFVHDAHPDYPSTWLAESWAKQRAAKRMPVQHHLAHAASVLASNGMFPQHDQRVAAVILDGTGFGTDGTAWGTECLLLNGKLQWSRLACPQTLPLVGAEAAIREPWRILVAALAMQGQAELVHKTPIRRSVPGAVLDTVASLALQPTWPRASGAGRLFEAVGALLGLTASNHWEGEAAARLEALACKSPYVAPWEDVLDCLRDAPSRFPAAALLLAAARRTISGASPESVARGFHETLCHLLVQICSSVVPEDVRVIAFGGGCFVNRLLRRGLREGMTSRGYTCLFAKDVPPGDGGLSYGQVVLAATALARGEDIRLIESVDRDLPLCSPVL